MSAAAPIDAPPAAPVSPPLSLDALRDIHLPPPPGWWPPAWGWWVLLLGLILCALLCGLWLYRRYHRYRRQAPLRAAIATLRALRYAQQPPRQPMDATSVVREVSALLRQSALYCHPDSAIAGLTGEQWCTYLNAHAGGALQFTALQCHDLLYVPYGGSPTSDTAALLLTAERWIKAQF